VLFGKYSSNGKYKSIAFSRIEDMQGFNRETNPSNLTNAQRISVLFFPFYAVGGINEHGVALGIAGISSQKIRETDNRKPIFVTNFIRQILDNCKTIDDAVRLSHEYYFYDHSLTTNSHHLLIGDSTGHSVIIEYKNGKMEYVYPNQNFQLFTNNNIIDNSTDNLNKCWRYKTINNQLSKRDSGFDTQAYLKILNKATNNTNWSVVYDLKNKQGIFTIYGNFSKQYKFGFE
jgi:penicillin V acylase-like amidase (Ntn superfamily)